MRHVSPNFDPERTIYVKFLLADAVGKTWQHNWVD